MDKPGFDQGFLKGLCGEPGLVGVKILPTFLDLATVSVNHIQNRNWASRRLVKSVFNIESIGNHCTHHSLHIRNTNMSKSSRFQNMQKSPEDTLYIVMMVMLKVM